MEEPTNIECLCCGHKCANEIYYFKHSKIHRFEPQFIIKCPFCISYSTSKFNSKVTHPHLNRTEASTPISKSKVFTPIAGYPGHVHPTLVTPYNTIFEKKKKISGGTNWCAMFSSDIASFRICEASLSMT